MLASLETRTCLLEVFVPVGLAQSHRIDIDYAFSPECNLIAPIHPLTSMKTRRNSVKSEKRLERWIRNAAVDTKFVPIDVNLSGKS
jgi:hypothetical protein